MIEKKDYLCGKTDILLDVLYEDTLGKNVNAETDGIVNEAFMLFF